MSQLFARIGYGSRPLRALRAVLVHEWWVVLRAYRVSFFLAVLLTSLFTLLIGYFLFRVVFSGHVTAQFVAYSGVHSYIAYLTVGVVTYNFTYRLLYPVRNFLFEQWEGTLPPLVLTGVPLLLYQAGCVIFSGLYSLVEAGILIAIIWPFAGFNLGHVNVLGVLLAAAGTFWALFGVSVVLSAIILYARDRAVVEGIAFTLMQLVGGVLFPVAYLPLPLQWLANAVPLTWGLNALRAAALDGASPARLAPDLLMLLLLGAAYALFGRWLLGRMVTYVLEDSA